MNNDLSSPSESTINDADVHTSTGPDRRALFILGAVAVAVLLVLVGRSFLRGDMKAELARKLAPELELNFAEQGVPVDITRIDCGDLPGRDGDFTVVCSVSMEGVPENIEATAIGNISGSRLSVSSATSDARLLNTRLAVSYVQQIVASQDQSVTVTSCELGSQIIVITIGDTFTCSLSTGEVATLTVNQNGSASITNVQ